MTFLRAKVALWAALFAITLVSSVVAAADTRGTDAAKAEALIAQGLRFMSKGRYPEAFAVFVEAYRLAPTPRAAAQIGFAELQNNHYVAAEDRLVEALAAESDRWISRNKGDIEKYLAEARAHIAKLLVTGPDGAEVLVDGEVRGRLPLPSSLRFDTAGQLLLTVTAADHLPFRKIVSLELGTTVTVSADPQPNPQPVLVPVMKTTPPPKAPELPPAPAPAERSTGYLLLGGALVATGAVAIAFGGYLIGQDGKGSCESEPDSQRCPEVYDTSTMGWILGGVGVGLVTGGMAVVIWGPPDPGTRIALLPGPGSLVAVGRF